MRAKSLRSDRGYHHGDLKTALLDAARLLLEQDGPEAISFRAIARASGVSQTAPYHHFKGKEELLATMAARGFHELESSQATAAAVSNPNRRRIVALGLDYVRFAVANPQLYRLMFGVGISDWCAYPEVAKIKHESFEPIHAALATYLTIDRKAPGAGLETAAVGAWALVHGLSMLIIDGSLAPMPDTKGPTPPIVARIVTQFVEGLRSNEDAGLDVIDP